MLPERLHTNLAYYEMGIHQNTPATLYILKYLKKYSTPNKTNEQKLIEICHSAILYLESTKQAFSLSSKLKKIMIKYAPRDHQTSLKCILEFAFDCFKKDHTKVKETKKALSQLQQVLKKEKDLEKCIRYCEKNKLPKSLKKVLLNTLSATTINPEQEEIPYYHLAMRSVDIYIWKDNSTSHVALKVARQYMSFRPVVDQQRSKCRNHFDDLRDIGRIAEHKITLHGLATDEIIEKFAILKQLDWQETTEEHCTSALIGLLILGGLKGNFSSFPDRRDIKILLEDARRSPAMLQIEQLNEEVHYDYVLEDKIKGIFKNHITLNQLLEVLSKAQKKEETEFGKTLITENNTAKRKRDIYKAIYAHTGIDIKLKLFRLKKALILGYYKYPKENPIRIRAHFLYEMVHELFSKMIYEYLDLRNEVTFDNCKAFFNLIDQINVTDRQESYNEKPFSFDFLNDLLKSYPDEGKTGEEAEKYIEQTKELKEKWSFRIRHLKNLVTKIFAHDVQLPKAPIEFDQILDLVHGIYANTVSTYNLRGS